MTLVWLTGWRRAVVSNAASVRALLQVQRRGDCGSPRAVGSTRLSEGKPGSSSTALVANSTRGEWRGLQFFNALGHRDARQAAGAAHP